MDDDPGDHGQAAPDVEIVPALTSEKEHHPTQIRFAATLASPVGHGEQHDSRDDGCEEGIRIIASTTELSLALLNMHTSDPCSALIGPAGCVPAVHDP